MKTTKKLVIAVVALSLALVAFASVSLAWLVAESNVVTNTFTYGQISLELWETDVNGQKTTSGTTFEKIVPGDVVNKNPTVTVVAGSENCYVYVLVTNNLVSTATNAVNPVATLNIGTDWVEIGSKGNATLYRYTSNPQAPGNYQVFSTVTFSGNLTVADVESMEDTNNQIIVKAYAHQSDNTNVGTADAAAIAWAKVDPITTPAA